MSNEVPEWRVTFWFLDDEWVQLGFAFVKAESEHRAVMFCMQRAVRRGFHANKDTRVEIRPERGDGRL